MDAPISGHVAEQLKAKTGQCWFDLLIGDTESREYLDFLSRGGLQIPLQALIDHVYLCFPVLEQVYPTIAQHGLPARAFPAKNY